jgi:hypothetical protein
VTHEHKPVGIVPPPTDLQCDPNEPDFYGGKQLSGGKITSTILVFDATEWRAMLAQQGKTVDAEGHVIDM